MTASSNFDYCESCRFSTASVTPSQIFEYFPCSDARTIFGPGITDNSSLFSRCFLSISAVLMARRRLSITNRDAFSLDIMRATLEDNIRIAVSSSDHASATAGHADFRNALEHVFKSAQQAPTLSDNFIPLLIHASKLPDNYGQLFFRILRAGSSFRLATTVERPNPQIHQEALRLLGLPALTELFDSIFPLVAAQPAPTVHYVYFEVPGLFAWCAPNGIMINAFAEKGRSTLFHPFSLMIRMLHETAHYKARLAADDFNLSSPTSLRATAVANYLHQVDYNTSKHVEWGLMFELLVVGVKLTYEWPDDALWTQLQIRFQNCRTMHDFPLIKVDERRQYEHLRAPNNQQFGFSCDIPMEFF